MGQWRTSAGCAAVCAAWACVPLASQTSIATAMHEHGTNGLVTASAGTADDGAVQAPASLEDALRAAFARAGVIFTGEVVSIDRTAGAVTVRWRVDDAVRGVGSVGFYEQKEWPGLWADGNARYRVGERALVLLHTPSVAGFASPVHDGVIALRGDTVTGTLDLRWMAQQVAATDAARLRPMQVLRAAGGDVALSAALQARTGQTARVPRARSLLSLPATDGGDANGGSSSGGAVLLAPPTGGTGDDVNAHVDGSMILGMLHAWQRDAVARR